MYTIHVYDIFTLIPEITISRDPSSPSPALDFIRLGYVVKTPVSPSIALSLTTLELYHRLRLRKPSFSAEAFGKVICDYYKVCHPFLYPLNPS